MTRKKMCGINPELVDHWIKLAATESKTNQEHYVRHYLILYNQKGKSLKFLDLCNIMQSLILKLDTTVFSKPTESH